jgi:hypothetical protein
MNVIIIFTILLLLIGNSFTQTCNSNFSCSSFCCLDDVCKDKSFCEKERNKVYIGVGIVAICFLLGSIIYLFVMLRGISVSMKQKRLDVQLQIQEAKDFHKEFENVKQ